MSLPPQAVSLEGHERDVNRTAFFPDGSRVITASDDGIARVFDTDTAALIFPFTDHRAAIQALAVLGTDMVATGDISGVICVWDARRKSCSYLAQHGHSVCSLAALSPSKFVAGLEDGTLLFFHHQEGDHVAVLHSLPNAHSHAIASISVHGHKMVTGSWDRTAKVWNSDSRVVLATLRGREGYVRGVAISSKHVVTIAGAVVQIWDSDTFTHLHRLDDKHMRSIFTVFILGTSHVLTGSLDKTIVVSDLATGSTIDCVVLNFSVSGAAATSDGRIAACGLVKSAVVFPARPKIARIIRAPSAAVAMRILGWHGSRSDKSYYMNSAEVRSWRAVANLPQDFDK